ncbi:hypothetical protein [Niallia sp. 03190]|uniref:hypothetical protein n=1 Tax=Niallia sp. 03190 TaxID=3458061 RepID=UPI0040451177
MSHDAAVGKRVVVNVLEDVNSWQWYESDLELLTKMWKENVSIREMAKFFRRDPDECLLACIHLARKSKIKNRGRTF